MEQAKIYVVFETILGGPYIAGAALTEDNAVIMADRIADAVVNSGAIPKVTTRRYDEPPTDEPREIRRYEFRGRPGHIAVLEMAAATFPDY